MKLKPNDSPDMELGEARRFTFNLAGAVGVNTIDSFTIENSNLTFGTPDVSGTTATVLVTADNTGTHAVIATAALSSGETVKGFLRVKVVDSTLCEGTTDYGRC